MKQIKVLGTGCAKCRSTVALIEQAAQAARVPISLHKVEDVVEIARHGVMRTPAVVIDGRVVHAGGVPAEDQVAKWLAQ